MSTLHTLSYATDTPPERPPAEATRDVIDVGDTVRAGRHWGTVTRLAYDPSGALVYEVLFGGGVFIVAREAAALVHKSEAWWRRWEAEHAVAAIVGKMRV